MKTMLLSFKPEWYEKIKSGEKIFEYRRYFAKEEVMAYMYVSAPEKKIVGKIHLGKRISLYEWFEKYKEYEDVRVRIEDFLDRHTYVMPIISFQMTESIGLNQLRDFKSDFVCPQMYYYLDNYPELFEYIRENAEETGEMIIHNFDVIDNDEICRKQYKGD